MAKPNFLVSDVGFLGLNPKLSTRVTNSQPRIRPANKQIGLVYLIWWKVIVESFSVDANVCYRRSSQGHTMWKDDPAILGCQPKAFFSVCAHRHKIGPRFAMKQLYWLSSLVDLLYMEPTDIQMWKPRVFSQWHPSYFPTQLSTGKIRKVSFLFKKWSGLGEASSLLFIIQTAYSLREMYKEWSKENHGHLSSANPLCLE